jgi:hypothetical protein
VNCRSAHAFHSMRTYFTILAVLLILGVWASYKMVTAIEFHRLDGADLSDSRPIRRDTGTSPCFEKRYSPDVQDCGGLLVYSTPTDVPKDPKAQEHERASQKPHARARGRPAKTERVPRALAYRGM